MKFALFSEDFSTSFTLKTISQCSSICEDNCTSAQEDNFTSEDNFPISPRGYLSQGLAVLEPPNFVFFSFCFKPHFSINMVPTSRSTSWLLSCFVLKCLENKTIEMSTS